MSNSIYVIKDAKRDQVIYIGRTCRNPEQRVQEHYNNAFRLSSFTKCELALALVYDNLEWELWYNDLSNHQSKMLEQQIVKQYKPIGNTYLV